MNEYALMAIIMRYQNDPYFHAFVDSMTDLIKKGLLDRDDVIDGLRLAERIMYEQQNKTSV